MQILLKAEHSLNNTTQQQGRRKLLCKPNPFKKIPFFRDAKALVTFTYGPPEMAEKTTIAIATVMPLPCGPFPSIPQSTLVKMPITTKVVPQLWHQLSQMAPKTLIREWQPLICMANVPGLTPEHRRQLQKLLESLPLPSKPSKAQN